MIKELFIIIVFTFYISNVYSSNLLINNERLICPTKESYTTCPTYKTLKTCDINECTWCSGICRPGLYKAVCTIGTNPKDLKKLFKNCKKNNNRELMVNNRINCPPKSSFITCPKTHSMIECNKKKNCVWCGTYTNPSCQAGNFRAYCIDRSFYDHCKDKVGPNVPTISPTKSPTTLKSICPPQIAFYECHQLDKNKCLGIVASRYCTWCNNKCNVGKNQIICSNPNYWDFCLN